MKYIQFLNQMKLDTEMENICLHQFNIMLNIISDLDTELQTAQCNAQNE